MFSTPSYLFFLSYQKQRHMTDIPPPTIPDSMNSGSENDELPTRWEIELEFVQSLANTQYLSYLAQQGYFKNPDFLNYINYLNYWKQPEYARFLVYPDCLHILTLLQNERFRVDILHQNFTNMLYSDMVEYWRESLLKDEAQKLDSVEPAIEIKNSPSRITNTFKDLEQGVSNVQSIQSIQSIPSQDEGRITSLSPMSDISTATPKV